MVITGEKSFEELHTLALTAARNIHLQDEVEHGRSIDKYGTVRKFSGDKDGVYIDVTEDTRIIVHNHPHEFKAPNTFSGYDVYNFLANKQLCESIVCGYGYYFYLRRGTFTGSPMEVKNSLEKLYQEVIREVGDTYAADPSNQHKSLKCRTKELNILFEAEFHNELAKELGRKGLLYGRVKL